MAWSIVAVGAVATPVASGNYTMTEPAGATDGDLLVACLSFRSNVAFGLPSGWALVATQQNSGDVDNTNGIASGLMAYIVRGPSAPALTFTRTGGDLALGRIVAYRGNHATAPLDTGSSNTLAVANATATTATITTAEAEELIVAFCSPGDNLTGSAFDAATDPTTASGATDTTTAPTNGTWIERADSGSVTGADGACIIADAVRATAGATGTIQATISASARHVMVAGAFKLAVSTEATQRSAGIAALEATATARSALLSTMEAPATERGAFLASLEATATGRNALFAELNKTGTERSALLAGLEAGATERAAALASLEAGASARLALAAELVTASTEATQRAALAAVLEATVQARGAALASLEATAQARAALAGDLTYEQTGRAALSVLLNAENRERIAAAALLNATATERAALTTLLNVEASERAALAVVLERIDTARVGGAAGLEAGASARAALTAAFEDEAEARAAILASLEAGASARLAVLVALTNEANVRAALAAALTKNEVARMALTAEFEPAGVPRLTDRGYVYEDWIFSAGSTTLIFSAVATLGEDLRETVAFRRSDGVVCSIEHFNQHSNQASDFEPVYTERTTIGTNTKLGPVIVLRQPLPAGASLYVESWSTSSVTIVNTHSHPVRADLLMLFDK